MTAWEFFEWVRTGELSEFDIYNQIEKMTNKFDEFKINLLCNEFDFYVQTMESSWLSDYSEEDIMDRVNELEKAGKELPLIINETPKNQLLCVNSFFLKKRYGKPISDTEFNKSLDDLLGIDPKIDLSKTIDTSRLMGGFYSKHDNFSLKVLRDLLVKIKRKHTDAVYRFDGKEPQINNIQPIHWLKGEESLRQFLDIIKSASLIDSRETDDIIQEHFLVDGQEPIKEPQPINWLKSKVLLAYLIQELSTKPNMHKPFIEPDKKWQLTELHFTVKGKEIGRSLVNDIKQSRFPNGCEEIDSILKRLTKH